MKSVGLAIFALMSVTASSAWAHPGHGTGLAHSLDHIVFALGVGMLWIAGYTVVKRLRAKREKHRK